MLDDSTDPDRLAAVLGGGLDAQTCARLLASSRLKGLMEAIVERRLDVPKQADPVPERWAHAATTTGDHLVTLARLAGAAWYARRLPLLVRRDDLAAFLAQAGEDAHSFGLRHIERGIEEPATVGGWSLAEQVVRDGLRCLDAWLMSAPPRVRAQLHLKLPVWGTPSTPLVGEQARWGAELIDLAAQEIDRRDV